VTEALQLLGKPVVEKIEREMAHRIQVLSERNINPCLVTILVGSDPASATYVRMKGNACKRVGIQSRRIHLPEQTTTEQLVQTIQALNADESVHGILLQHPVPGHIDERLAFDTIQLNKDVDGVTSAGFGCMAFDLDAHGSCTPEAILRILDHYDIALEGKRVVVIGRSAILGKPVALMLLNRNATVTICHSKTLKLDEIVHEADIVVAAVGKPEFIRGAWIKPGAVVMDAGYNEGNVGDVEYHACLSHVSAITPVPGGVGPVTIATLLEHTVRAAEQIGIADPQ
jgi:methylenetetrahydrofolate dehydrogenase (NADP+) / methenyltetrahydrofolate cyclohydrolase